MRMNYSYLWDKDNDKYLKNLRDAYKLNRMLAGTQLGTLENCTKWVGARWKHSSSGTATSFEPIAILKDAKKGKRFRCVEYSIVLKGCLAALGIKARVLGLRMKDVETRKYGAGHVVVEAYLPKYEKWVMADPQFATIAMLGKVPLNAVELRDAIETGAKLRFYNMNSKEADSYIGFIRSYLFYFRFKFDQRVMDREINGLLLMPVGAKKPVKFEQGDMYSSERNRFTHSERLFYKSPGVGQS